MSNSWVFVSWFVEFFLIIWTKHEPQPVAVQQNKKIRQRVAGGWWGGMKAMVQQTEQSHFLALNLFLLYQLVWHNCMKNKQNLWESKSSTGYKGLTRWLITASVKSLGSKSHKPQRKSMEWSLYIHGIYNSLTDCFFKTRNNSSPKTMKMNINFLPCWFKLL